MSAPVLNEMPQQWMPAQASRPSVSAVVTTYNRAKSVIRAIESILAQELACDEVVVIDDGSTDDTADLIRERFASRVRLVTQLNGGVSAARRRGVIEARSEWIAFLDSDDEWTPGRMQQFSDAVRDLPSDVAWLFGNTVEVSETGEDRTIFEQFGLRLTNSPTVFEDGLSVQFPYQFGLFQSSLIRRHVLQELDCFVEGLRSSEDVLVGCQVACKYRFAAIPYIVTRLNRTKRDDSLTSNCEFGPDYFRARVKAFDLLSQIQPHGPWPSQRAVAMRGLCQALAREGRPASALALEHFRKERNFKALVFLAASLFGRHGFTAWTAARKLSTRMARMGGGAG